MTTEMFANYLAGREPQWTGTICLDPGLVSHENKEEADKLQSLVALARQRGWREAVAEVYGKTLLGYVDNPDRLIFIPLLPLEARHRILEIGPGLGQISLPLARVVQSVDALEVVRGQAEFGAERARQEGVTNIRFTAGGDKCLLPFQDESFDGVVFNLVLEWCGARLRHIGHQEAHVLLLGEIARVLKPGGFVYLATKNRYALRCLTGGRDEHFDGMRFGSALPRWLAGLLHGTGRPPGHLHSHSELRGMLGDAGFERIEGYWAVPEMRWPKQMIALDQALGPKRAKLQFDEGENPRTTAIMGLIPSSLVKHFTPGLSFLARRSGA